mmetsp:Transcript_3284/g.4825  ORF Transcript_3284/g.4825 Transcript_3284/m.4825 type:complete len:246 (+) Transcript_3284:583-1320(+)
MVLPLASTWRCSSSIFFVSIASAPRGERAADSAALAIFRAFLNLDSSVLLMILTSLSCFAVVLSCDSRVLNCELSNCAAAASFFCLYNSSSALCFCCRNSSTLDLLSFNSSLASSSSPWTIAIWLFTARNSRSNIATLLSESSSESESVGVFFNCKARSSLNCSCSRSDRFSSLSSSFCALSYLPFQLSTSTLSFSNCSSSTAATTARGRDVFESRNASISSVSSFTCALLLRNCFSAVASSFFS